MVPRRPAERIAQFAIGVPIAGVAAGLRLFDDSARQGVRVAERLAGLIATELVGLAARDATQPETLTDRPSAGTGPASGPIDMPVDMPVDMPIEGFDDLPAIEIVDLLDGLGPSELELVERYERAGRGRRTVLAKLETLQSRA